jgi:general secretion pathway protein D
MKHQMIGTLLVALSAAAWGAPLASDPASNTTRDAMSETKIPAIPITQLIDTVARKTGQKFILSANVQAQIQMVGLDPNRVSYADLLTILDLHGYTAVESGGDVLIVPLGAVRDMPLPLASGKTTYPDSQYVSAIITVANMPAATLVPVLRPLMPTHGHLAAIVCSNSLLLVDTFANVKRLELLVKTLDVGDPYKPSRCEAPVAKPQ